MRLMDKKVLLKLLLLFIPVAYGSFLFHEFGHWIVGGILGYDMRYSLNAVWPKAGNYTYEIHGLFVNIGGVVFTILLSIVGLLIIEKYQLIYMYPLVFYQMLMRLGTNVFASVSMQDEGKISTSLNLGTYTVSILVILLLFLIVLKASLKLKINLLHNGFFLAMGLLCQLIVVETSKMLL